MMFMHLTSACTFFNEIEAELSRKHSSYWLQNQLFKVLKLISHHPGLRIYRYIGFIKWVKPANEPPWRVSKADILSVSLSLWVTTNAWNIGYENSLLWPVYIIIKSFEFFSSFSSHSLPFSLIFVIITSTARFGKIIMMVMIIIITITVIFVTACPSWICSFRGTRESRW